MKIKLFFLLICFIISLPSSWGANSARYQFNINLGTDTPEKADEDDTSTSTTDDDDKRTGNASLVQFTISTRPRVFRVVGGFTGVFGSGLKQGEFVAGPHIYPFNEIAATPVQPFLFAEGKLGVGSLNDTLRYDFGYGMGVGIDFKLFQRSGLTLAIEQHNATEDSFRIWLGFYLLGK